MKNKIDLFKVFMAPTAAHEVGKVLNSGYIGQGPIVEEFEENFAKKLYSELGFKINGQKRIIRNRKYIKMIYGNEK